MKADRMIKMRVNDLLDEAKACLKSAVFLQVNRYEYRYAPDADYDLEDFAEEAIQKSFSAMCHLPKADFAGKWSPEKPERETILLLREMFCERMGRVRFAKKPFRRKV